MVGGGPEGPMNPGGGWARGRGSSEGEGGCAWIWANRREMVGEVRVEDVDVDEVEVVDVGG